jgi:hypothetical protein
MNNTELFLHIDEQTNYYTVTLFKARKRLYYWRKKINKLKINPEDRRLIKYFISSRLQNVNILIDL